MRIKTKVSVIIFLISLTNWASAQEQKTLFCAESISYRVGRYKLMDSDTCKSMCEPYSGSNCLSNQTMNGWQVISLTSKQETQYGGQDGANCSCVGTQYALRKDPPKEKLAPPALENNSKVAEQGLWQEVEKEIEIYRKMSPSQNIKENTLKNNISKPSIEVFRGQVFIVRKDLSNVRLALVGVAAFNESDVAETSQWQRLLTKKLREKFTRELEETDSSKGLNFLAETESEFSEMTKAGFAEARGTNEASAYNALRSKRNSAWESIGENPEKVAKIKTKLQYIDLPEFSIRSLPDPVATAKTDSDGNFEMTLPVGSYVLRAKTSSTISSIDEELLWFVKVRASKSSQKLVLSNDNIFGSNCDECANPPKP